MRRDAALCALCLVALAGCRTTSQTTSAIASEAVVSTGSVSGLWQVVDDGRTVGFLVRFEDAAAPGHTFFSVRNERHQELGMIDRLGRAFRYRPHEREPEWLGTGTVLDGTRRILGAGTALEEVEWAGAGGVPTARPNAGNVTAPTPVDDVPDRPRDDA
jgi:hypothetical protein